MCTIFFCYCCYHHHHHTYYVHMCMCACRGACVWRSEDDVQEPILFLDPVGRRQWTQAVRLVPFALWAASPVLHLVFPVTWKFSVLNIVDNEYFKGDFVSSKYDHRHRSESGTWALGSSVLEQRTGPGVTQITVQRQLVMAVPLRVGLGQRAGQCWWWESFSQSLPPPAFGEHRLFSCVLSLTRSHWLGVSSLFLLLVSFAW